MKADFGDAPERILRTQQKRGIQRFATYAVAGCIAAVSGFILLNRSEPDRGSALQVAENLRSGRDSGEMSSGSVIRPGPSLDLQSPNTGTFVNQARQTVFNDQNFIPTGAHNVVTFHDTVREVPREEPPKKAKLTIVRQTPSMKDRACWPFRQGSIESRNCRDAIGLNHRD
jgi:hypothetical protein